MERRGERGPTVPPDSPKQAPQMIVSEAGDAKPISLDKLSLWGNWRKKSLMITLTTDAEFRVWDGWLIQ